jgi:hypothetical protein
MREHRFLIVAFGLLAAALPAAAQNLWWDVEAGYQWVDVSGNVDMYRSQINEDDGFVLNGFSLTALNPSGEAGLFDQLSIDASGFGGRPTGRFRLDTGLGKTYRLHLLYSQSEHYSALPELANPFADEGIIPGQHTFDRDRQVVDVQLELLPGRTVTPILGYRWNRYDGPLRTTYHVGEDEFQIGGDRTETEDEYYGGIAFAAGSWRGTVLQGWRSFEGTETLGLEPGAEDGNNPGTVVGEDVSLASFFRSSRTEADTPVTTATVTGSGGDVFHLRASYFRADAESDTSTTETLDGSLVSYRLRRLFSGLDDSVSGRTESPSWRGDVDLEFEFSDKLAVDLLYDVRHRRQSGWALISSLYLDTMTFSGYDARDIEQIVEASNGLDRQQDTLGFKLTARDIGPVQLWAEATLTEHDFTLDESLAEIVIPGAQEGTFNRDVDAYGIGASVAIGQVKLLGEVISEQADQLVLRTDFIDRLRVRARFDWKMAELLRLQGTAETVGADNRSEGVGYDAQTDHTGLSLDLTPVPTFDLRLSWDSYSTDTSATIRNPQDFSLAESFHSEDGELLEGSLSWRFDPITVTGGYSTFGNDGSFGFDLERAFARLSVDISDHLGAAVEFDTTDYSEAIGALGDFTADRWGLFVRWRG